MVDRYWLIIPPGRGKPRISCRPMYGTVSNLKAGEHAVRLVVTRPQAQVIGPDLKIEVPPETPRVEAEEMVGVV